MAKKQSDDNLNESVWKKLADEEGGEEIRDELQELIEQDNEGKTPATGMFKRGKAVIDSTYTFSDRDNEKSKERRKEWEKLTNMYRRKDIISAQVVEASWSEDHSRIYVRANIDDNFSVTIRDSEFFAEDEFKRNYQNASDEEKNLRKAEKARACIGAWIPFIIKGMSSEWDEETQEPIFTIIGDRQAALQAKQKIYFKGVNPVSVGDTTVAEVVSVGEHLANLEVLGVMCSVRVQEIDAFSYITDCRDALKPGDRLEVAIRQIYINDDGTVKLNVSGATIGYSKMAKNTMKLVKGSTHSGIVKNYNPKNGIYTIVTSGGASVAVPSKAVVGREILLPGDPVTVTITNITPNMAYGTARRR